MRARIITRWTLLCLLLLPFGLIVLFNLGPPWAFLHNYNSFGMVSLPDGSKLSVISHRTGSFLEPYEVNLYRFWPDGASAADFLSHADSYWWGASIRTTSVPGRVEIRACWQLVATFDDKSNEVLLVESMRRYGPRVGRDAQAIRRFLF